MASIRNPHSILLFVISCTLIVFTSSSALDLSSSDDVAAEAPGYDGLLPLAQKHVVIRNTVFRENTLNVHCKSSEDDLGVIHLPYNQTWGFSFHVNLWKTTRFRCHFTWYNYGDGDYYFDIFKVSRDDSPFGGYPVCKECIWEVGRYYADTICRIFRDGADPYCFQMDKDP